MRLAYLDCFSGAAGDMILAALVDAGWPLDDLRGVVTRLALPDVTVRSERVTRGGLAATRVQVEVGAGARQHHRHLPDVLAIINRAALDPHIREQATRAFTRLAEAEARVHGTTPDRIHFHEVGAADAIVDIVGACAGVAALGLDRIVCAPVPVGCGTITCEHGVLPVPAPATVELLRGVPLAASDEPGELTTPTGAALLTTLAESFGPLPPMRITAIGCGAGTRENRTRPNVLRLLIGEPAGRADGEHDEVVVLEANLDDADGQTVAWACQRLLEAGALDAWVVPIIMKKGRPGQIVAALARPAEADDLEALLLRETPTLGVRRQTWQRRTLPREQVSVPTPFGPVRVKIAREPDGGVRAWPEFDDCAAAARQSGATLRAVHDAALAAWQNQHRA